VGHSRDESRRAMIVCLEGGAKTAREAARLRVTRDGV
jgi:hypothetical protein